ncbi:MAG: hypothetical protein KDA78_12580 [Planctomycetaceae bacterium]|nr:hypothetical protein [Planctomycetaceae bacterium]
MNVYPIYEVPVMRGHRIARMSEKRLGDFRFDSDTANVLTEDNLAVMIGNCHDMDWIREKIGSLAECDDQNEYVAIATTKILFQNWFTHSDYSEHCPSRIAPAFWREGAVTYATPESLPQLTDVMGSSESPACLLIIDPYGNMPFAQGNGKARSHNRSNLLVKFSNRFEERPPLVYLTSKPAKSLNTAAMLAPMAIDGWWYVDGKSLRIGPPTKVKSNNITDAHICV